MAPDPPGCGFLPDRCVVPSESSPLPVKSLDFEAVQGVFREATLVDERLDRPLELGDLGSIKGNDQDVDWLPAVSPETSKARV